MSHWNYRLLKFRDEGSETGWTYGVVEAHYNDAGELYAHSKTPFIIGDTEQDVIEELETIRTSIMTQDTLVEGEFRFADQLSDE